MKQDYKRNNRSGGGFKRSEGGFKKSFSDRGGFKKDFGDRKPFGERKSYGDRDSGFKKSYGDRKPFSDRKTFSSRDGGFKKDFGDRKPFGERKSFSDRGGFKKDFGDRKPFSDRKPYGERSFGDRKPFSERRSFSDRDGGFKTRSFGDRKPYGERSYSDRKPFGERKSFSDRPFRDRKEGGFKKEWTEKKDFSSEIKDKKDTSWGKVATWYQSTVSRDDSYQKKLIIPNLIRLVDIKEGDKVLEVACGEGNMSRALAEAGAEVTGIDISPELIELAKKNSSEKINFLVSPADNLSSIDDKSFDKEAIVLALQNIENDKGVINEMSRVLKDDGKIFIVLNHPCFRIPKNSSWGYDEKRDIQYRRVDRYISDSREMIEMHPGDKSEETTVSFHHPFQHYFKIFEKSGLAVTRLEEWVSEKTSAGKRADAENRARKEIPMFIMLVLKKIQ